MKRALTLAALVIAGSFATAASAQTAAKAPDPALVDAYIKSTFGKAPPEWQARIEPDETLKTCNAFHNDVPSAEA
ncbi:MAG: sulfur oxidation c-type cytochrome SoxX, partial [Tardiphaga sp.]